ncbi:MAG: HlyU family transcriptional regulator [Roseobacter sp.]
MSFFKKLFGGVGNAPEAEATATVESYEGFRITPTPISEGGTFRISALIEKEIDGDTKQHTLVRADTVQGIEIAQEASIRKAKQVIDEQGDRIFN